LWVYFWTVYSTRIPLECPFWLIDWLKRLKSVNIFVKISLSLMKITIKGRRSFRFEITIFVQLILSQISTTLEPSRLVLIQYQSRKKKEHFFDWAFLNIDANSAIVVCHNWYACSWTNNRPEIWKHVNFWVFFWTFFCEILAHFYYKIYR